MAEQALRAEEYHHRKERIAGWDAGVTSYKIGEEYFCEVDNSNPGGRIARAKGGTREEAERKAIAEAGKLLAATRVHETH